MAFLSNILAVAQPTGAWVSIIRAFEGAVGNYVLAIILLTIVLRLVWSIVETFNKYTTQKMSAIQSQMQPEMEKLKAKYEKQPQILQQKQNELQQRYMGKSQIGSCVITLVVMILNLVIFFTLFSGLNSVASYKITSNYDNLKYTYANCLYVADEYISREGAGKFANYENLKFVIKEGETRTISLVEVDGDNIEVLVDPQIFEYNFSTEENNPAYTGEEGSEEPEKITITSNENIYNLIIKYFPVDAEGNYDPTQDIVLKTEMVEGEDGQPVEVNTYLSQAIQSVAMQNIVSEYDGTMESFLWIKNIWIADSPLTNSILNYNSLAAQMGKKNVGEKEEEIYNAFMPDLKEERNQTNGYMILPILCVLAAMLSTFITTLYNKHKNKKKGLPPMKRNAKWAQIIVPVLLGIFALFYNSVFSIYMLTGQVVSALILPLQLFVVDKIMEKREKKKEEEKVTVDYSRKF